MLKLSSVLLWS